MGICSCLGCLACPCLAWLFNVRVQVILHSAILALCYGSVAYVLDKTVLPVLDKFDSYRLVRAIIGSELSKWISELEIYIWTCIAYAGVGLCGLVGAVFEWEWMLWVYAIYLAGSWVVNCWTVIKEVEVFLGIESDIATACKIITLGFGSCSSEILKIKEYSVLAGCIIMGIHGILFFCCCVLLHRVRKQKHAEGKGGRTTMTEKALGRRVRWRRRRWAKGLRRDMAVRGMEEGEEEEGIPLRDLGGGGRDMEEGEESEEGEREDEEERRLYGGSSRPSSRASRGGGDPRRGREKGEVEPFPLPNDRNYELQ